MRRAGPRVLALVALVGGVTSACGGSSASSGSTVDATRAVSVLQQARWQAKPVAGMPDTYTKARQVAYLQTVAPDGCAIDLQFLETPDLAAAELAAATPHGYVGSTIANVIVLPHATAKGLCHPDVDALDTLLTS